MGNKLTPHDVEKIQEEIDHRTLVVRPKLLEEVKETRAQGDLSENFEYHEAKRAKNQNESRIRYLTRVLKNATIIDDSSKEDEVGINNTVTIYFEDEDEEETYKLVTSIRGNSMHGLISIESPLGKALLHHKVGDLITVQVDANTSYDCRIKEIDKSSGDDDDLRAY